MITLFSSILITPHTGWETAKKQTDRKSVLIRYALPLILLTSAASFAGVMIENDAWLWEMGLKRFTVTFLTLFFSIYIAAFCIKIMYNKMFNESYPLSEILVFTIYSFSCIFAVIFLDELFEDMFFIGVFTLYTLYIVYEGASVFFNITDKKLYSKKILFTVIASLLIIACPDIIKDVVLTIMPGLR
ncbi:MAG: YIP1 family protein [Paludibacteraceae bacterium]|nr:YIP1 family protein [Paludibacteraceae bacterium]